VTTKTGILLVNLGTPAAPTTAAVRRFSASFCTISGSSTCRATSGALLHFIILPTRSPKVAKLYQQVWTEQGSP
jgi:ferrochelatase